MKRKNKFYITTPLYYVNAAPHIGHSYTQVAADALARFHRLSGEEVFFMTGTDEHGEKIEKAALESGFKSGEEKRFVDGIVPNFKKLWKDIDIKYDFFIRTTDGYHEKAVRHILEVLHKTGDIYKGRYDGWFCTPCEAFWAHAQAPDGICPDCKRGLEKISEENYFFKISKYQKWLIGYIKENPDFILPDYRKNEVLSFLENNALNDLCISRPKKRLRWGIELPFDKEYVAYVWVDALINYISGPGLLNDKARFKRFWPADIHLIGKDILRHHAVYWPIILRAADIPMPRTIFAHGWWITKGEKMSKSKGNIVDPRYIIDKYGVDPYRYFLLREVPFGLDGSFSEEALIRRFNSDLANDLGNLLNRTLTMVEKYFGGRVPGRKGRGADYDTDIEDLAKRVSEAMERLRFSDALSLIWELVNKANKSIEVKAPWKLHKEERDDELSRFIGGLAGVLAAVAVLVYPFMPQSAENMWRQLGLEKIEKIRLGDMERLKAVAAGAKIRKGAPLFPRIKK